MNRFLANINTAMSHWPKLVNSLSQNKSCLYSLIGQASSQTFILKLVRTYMGALQLSKWMPTTHSLKKIYLRKRLLSISQNLLVNRLVHIRKIIHQPRGHHLIREYRQKHPQGICYKPAINFLPKSNHQTFYPSTWRITKFQLKIVIFNLAIATRN